ncbi:MAG: tyrosine-type recombinase/integrase [Deltaproteobacteria bacterium]|nr:tyrosine-type recombinase/integrase [Deltaproteobacteria bacterium]
MADIAYNGPFGKYIKNHVQLKQSVGYKYIAEAEHLKRFDTFTLGKYSSVTALTKEIVLDWCRKKPYEAQANQCIRASIIRQFCKYLDSVGVEAFIMPKNYYPQEIQYMPHIYTDEELKRFFAETEKCHYSSEFPYRHLIMPVFFRMVYTCGLRVSEARLLKVGEVDLDSGILAIHHSKKDNSRLVPMADSLGKRCREYSATVHPQLKPDEYYFPALGGKLMTHGNVYKNFRKFLWRAGISHGGRGYGPRIHDFRHSFCVHCLNKWSKQGKDLMVYLPILRTYLGHDSFRETAYYLRLTADIFPDITLKLESLYPDLIPQLEGGCHETE